MLHYFLLFILIKRKLLDKKKEVDKLHVVLVAVQRDVTIWPDEIAQSSGSVRLIQFGRCRVEQVGCRDE